MLFGCNFIITFSAVAVTINKEVIMGTRNTFKVLFYIKKNAPLRNGNTPIMGRITINGQRTQLSTRLSVDPKLWNVNMGRVTGRRADAVRVHEQLSQIRYHIERCYNTLFYEHAQVTPQMVKEMYFGNDRRSEMLLAFFREHNEEFRRMVGTSRSKTTYYKYRSVYNHLENYISGKYERRDLSFRDLDREFLTGFHQYIAQECGHKKNTTWIYMIALKHILMLARGRGYLTTDLFANYKLHSEFVTRNYLSITEIRRLIRLDLDDVTLLLVRDAFLFSCFTGLSYIDLCTLTPEHIRQEGKQMWISTTRCKTGSEVNVRVFAIPYAILLRYNPMNRTKRIFNLPSNGWCNICLDRIMSLAGISRHITFHSARHTFATTITLSQGIAIETISKLLGHRNIRTTQIYATITHSKLDGDMERLSKRLDTLYRESDLERVPEPV